MIPENVNLKAKLELNGNDDDMFYVGLNKIITHKRCLEIFSSIPCPVKRER